MGEFSAGAASMYHHKLAGLHQPAEHTWIQYAEPSLAFPVAHYHGTVCLGMTTVHTGGVQTACTL